MLLDVDGPALVGLRVLAEPMRWRIVQLLAGEELCVCHLVDDLEVGQPLVSHHLRVLRDAGFVETERYRYWTYYRLRPEALRVVAAGLDRLVRDVPKAAHERRPCC